MPNFTIRSTKTEVTQVLIVITAKTKAAALEKFNENDFDNSYEQHDECIECTYTDPEVLT